jgi:hypothetical protein
MRNERMVFISEAVEEAVMTVLSGEKKDAPEQQFPDRYFHTIHRHSR